MGKIRTGSIQAGGTFFLFSLYKLFTPSGISDLSPVEKPLTDTVTVSFTITFTAILLVWSVLVWAEKTTAGRILTSFF